MPNSRKPKTRVYFLIDDDDTKVSRTAMLRDNTGPNVDSDPKFISWLKKARPGDVFRHPIGGGWTTITCARSVTVGD